jgi:hypothetical protein
MNEYLQGRLRSPGVGVRPKGIGEPLCADGPAREREGRDELKLSWRNRRERTGHRDDAFVEIDVNARRRYVSSIAEFLEWV